MPRLRNGLISPEHTMLFDQLLTSDACQKYYQQLPATWITIYLLPAFH